MSDTYFLTLQTGRRVFAGEEQARCKVKPCPHERDGHGILLVLVQSQFLRPQEPPPVAGWDGPVGNSDHRGDEWYMADVLARTQRNPKNPSPESTCLIPNNQIVVIRLQSGLGQEGRMTQ